MKRKILIGLSIVFILFGLFLLAKGPKEQPTPIASSNVVEPSASEQPQASVSIKETDEFDTKEEVALYIYTFGHLPNNYMTKKEARKKGWDGGALHLVVPGKCIGGDVYSNFEGTLPEKAGRTYYECDIDTLTKKKRGAKRIVFSNDGLVYYTNDHYDTFELLYGEEAYENKN